MSTVRTATHFAVFLVAGLLTGYLNRGHIEQQTIFWAHHVPMAQHFVGTGEREVLTYPLWGYPFLLVLLRDHAVLVGVQILVATIVMIALLLRLRQELGQQRGALTVLFIAAIPWYTLHSVKWPQSCAVSLTILGILLLERACRASSGGLGLAAGVAFGMALQFRSEFLYFPLVITGIALLARKRGGVTVLPVRPVMICAVAALLLMVPWAIRFHRQTGRVSFTASNGGMVAFLSLGQLPRNPWGVRLEDEYAYEYLKARGVAASALSSAGDRILSAEFVRNVRADPFAFAAKVGWNGASTLLSGFYNGEVPLDPGESERLRRLKSGLKAIVLPGREPSDDGPVHPRVYVALAHWVVLKSAGVLFVLVSLCGLVASLHRGLRSPILLLLDAYIGYQFMVVLLLGTEPRHLNGLFLALVPFFVIAASDIRRAVSRWRRSSASAMPWPHPQSWSGARMITAHGGMREHAISSACASASSRDRRLEPP